MAPHAAAEGQAGHLGWRRRPPTSRSTRPPVWERESVGVPAAAPCVAVRGLWWRRAGGSVMMMRPPAAAAPPLPPFDRRRRRPAMAHRPSQLQRAPPPTPRPHARSIKWGRGGSGAASRHTKERCTRSHRPAAPPRCGGTRSSSHDSTQNGGASRPHTTPQGPARPHTIRRGGIVPVRPDRRGAGADRGGRGRTREETKQPA